MNLLHFLLSTLFWGCFETKESSCASPTWEHVSLGSESSWDGELVGVWGNTPGTIHLVGVSGQHWVGSGDEWTQLSPEGSTPAFRALWGAAQDDLFAITDDNAIWRYDGFEWSVDVDAIPNVILRGIHGSSTNNVYAVGFTEDIDSSGVVYRRTTAGWEPVELPANAAFHQVFVQSADLVWVVGDNGYIARFNGTEWTQYPTPTEKSIQAIWPFGSDGAFAVGGDWEAYTSEGQGIILSFDGQSWSVHKDATWTVFDSMWGSESGDMWAVGDVPDEEDPDGRIWHFSGTDWQEHSKIWASPNSIWGTDSQNIYTVGFGGEADRDLFHYSCH